MGHDALAYSNADLSELLRWSVLGVRPHSSATLDKKSRDTKVAGNVDDDLFEHAHKVYECETVLQAHHGIRNKLTWAVPRHFSASAYWYYGCAVRGELLGSCASACRIDGLVLKNEKSAPRSVSDKARDGSLLEFEPSLIGNKRGCKARQLNVEGERGFVR